MHWRANKDGSKGSVCTAPSGIPNLCGPLDFTITERPAGATAKTPLPLTLPNWACPTSPGDAGAGDAGSDGGGDAGCHHAAVTGMAPGSLYITDANGSWTPAYAGTLTCGAPDGGTPDAGSCDAGTDAHPICEPLTGTCSVCSDCCGGCGSTVTCLNGACCVEGDFCRSAAECCVGNGIVRNCSVVPGGPTYSICCFPSGTLLRTTGTTSQCNGPNTHAGATNPYLGCCSGTCTLTTFALNDYCN